MIIVRAPMRISFVGGGTDLPDFYRQYPGRVLSTTINKYIYISLNPSYAADKFILKYKTTEIISDLNELKHDRFRAALQHLGIDRGLEIASFADVPAQTGLGSSSTFSVALMKALNAYLGKTMSRHEAAEAACKLEIELLNEPIGKQDQFAAAHGGLNIFQFNPDDTVSIEPVLLDYKKRKMLQDHLLLFFSGMERPASSVLEGQRKKIAENLETYKKMSDSVFEFRDKLLAGDMKGVANMLHEGWLRKKTLASNISNSPLDALYESAMAYGAWGGKILGAGGGGCLLVVADPAKHNEIRSALKDVAAKNGLKGFQEIEFSFSQSGADVMFNDSGHRSSSMEFSEDKGSQKIRIIQM